MVSYIRELRKIIGSRKIIHPGARILVENHRGEILTIQRKDNGKIGLPSGGLEENETIEECIIREVREETGLSVDSVKVIGISTHPETETVNYPNGDRVQYFTVEFYADRWEGEIKVEDTDEIASAQFMERKELKNLHANEFSTLESLDYFKRTGSVLVR